MDEEYWGKGKKKKQFDANSGRFDEDIYVGVSARQYCACEAGGWN